MSSPEGRFSRGAALRAEGLRVRLGSVLILDGVNVEVNPGELVGLVGPNGAGKTVLFDCLSGLVRASTGSVFLGDDLVTDAPASWRVWHGLGRTFQEGRLFDSLPVEVNVALASCIHSGSFISDGFSMPWSVLGRREMLNRAREALDVVVGAHLWGRPAASLTGADRRRVEIARALAAKPRVLLLDEPAAGLEPGALDLGRLVLRLRDELGIAVMLVEHDPALVFSICDFVYALDAGTVVASGPPALVREDPHMRRSYLGVA
jgi:ABC-type branched-subunit amino acid transport system ATPase component